MKIAYKSAYVQTETFNFTFAQQAIIVYVYLCSNFQEIASRMPNIKVKADYFLPIMLDCTLIASKQSIGYSR